MGEERAKLMQTLKEGSVVQGVVKNITEYGAFANPAGDQLLVTFTLGQAQSETFGDADLKLIGGLEWTGKRRR